MRVFSKVQYFWNLAKDSVLAWMDDYPPSMGAALAFYTVFELGPIEWTGKSFNYAAICSSSL